MGALHYRKHRVNNEILQIVLNIQVILVYLACRVTEDLPECLAHQDLQDLTDQKVRFGQNKIN